MKDLKKLGEKLLDEIIDSDLSFQTKLTLLASLLITAGLYEQAPDEFVAVIDQATHRALLLVESRNFSQMN